jgi:molecular chaperone GrpE (heat shock protein)
MNKVSEWKVPKWPFLVTDAILLVVAAAVVWKARHPISAIEIGMVTGCVALGALLACLPFVLDYRATAKLIELNVLGEVSEKIEDLKSFTAQVATVTDQWARVQEITQGNSEKTVVAARDISDRIATEVRDFTEFQKKMNDAEKGALRLEVEKLRRIEGDWLQVVVRILDNIFALHNAAIRSGQAELASQIGHFQNACRDAARRVGLVPFVVEREEAFDSERHRAHGVENPPADAVAEETLAPGLTFQGRMIRPALVRLRENNPPAETPAAESTAVASLEPLAQPAEVAETVETKTEEELPFQEDEED